MAVFEPLFAYALMPNNQDTSMRENAFFNTFDAPVHQEDALKAFLERVYDLFIASIGEVELVDVEKSKTSSEKPLSEEQQKLRAFDGLLRFIQFHTEKEDRR
jgi:hypothetical protein